MVISLGRNQRSLNQIQLPDVLPNFDAADAFRMNRAVRRSFTSLVREASGALKH
jgi:hypothetical protein